MSAVFDADSIMDASSFADSTCLPRDWLAGSRENARPARTPRTSGARGFCCTLTTIAPGYSVIDAAESIAGPGLDNQALVPRPADAPRRSTAIGAYAEGLRTELRTRAPSVNIVVLSMHEEVTDLERALRAGAAGYVMKRETTKSVLTAIRRVLEGGTAGVVSEDEPDRVAVRCTHVVHRALRAQARIRRVRIGREMRIQFAEI